ncbi:aspartate aminotransferase [Oxobacter pfennigii]|uniref:Aminotransferase n=1 Tax=Oxobacter pfennigii TaxID=36849 RepID=A0A0P9AHB2_9CLOT|nr:pyridoxal phosphate-dependent aminotransferase [Oxobacter pfennigii]KPU44851.1 aspartate aminotransferase [Oxobacter pfennigii]
MLKFSERAINMQSSPIRKLAPLAAAAKKKGKKVYHLNIGQPDIHTPKEFFDAVSNLDMGVLSYVDSQGIPEAINSFRKYYTNWDIHFEEDEVYVTNGGSEALLFAILAVCDYGDDILMPEPFYTNYNSFTSIAGVNIVSFPTKAEAGFHLPVKDIITKSITKKTRAILLSNPGNPTGVVYTKEELYLVAEIAKEYDLFIIADEVYREFVYDGLKYTSFMHLPEIKDRVILIDSISKRYSACGARIGLMATKNRELLPLFLKLCQSRLCASALDQIGAAALINTPKEYFAEVLEEYQARRDVVYNALSNMKGVICQKPTGAFYVVAKLPVENAEDYVKFLLTDFDVDNETVMLAPAEGFYSTEGLGKDEVRISYCLNCEDLKKAMNVIEKGLEAFNK